MAITDLFPEYATTSAIDILRETEYSHLDTEDHVYLDYTGSSLAAKAQHLHHASRLTSAIYGNPHSLNPTSRASTEEVESTRSRVLSHLNASPDEYTVIFTQNATGAARLIAESYPFEPSQRLVLTADNHNSVNGIRVTAASKGSETVYVPLETPSLRLDTSKVLSALSTPNILGNARGILKRVFSGCIPHLATRSLSSSSSSSSPSPSSSPLSSTSEKATLSQAQCQAKRKRTKGLFAFPAQSNFTGIQHPLSLVSLAQSQGYDVLLDAAAYLPTSALDLSAVKPEFLMVSFYKLFGYPTGVGCLVAKKSALAKLSRPWFAGGTIQFVTVQVQWHAMLDYARPETYEDGTLNFLSIPDVKFGLDWISERAGMDLIQTRVRCLTGWTLSRLKELRHGDGKPIIKIYGSTETKMRGGTIAFNLVDAAGKIVDERLVAMESAAARISLRTGCFCNPGAGEYALGVGRKDLWSLVRHRNLDGGMDQFISLVGLPSAGAIRVSFGIASNAADVDRLFGFLEKTYKNRVTVSDHLDPRESC